MRLARNSPAKSRGNFGCSTVSRRFDQSIRLVQGTFSVMHMRFERDLLYSKGPSASVLSGIHHSSLHIVVLCKIMAHGVDALRTVSIAQQEEYGEQVRYPISLLPQDRSSHWRTRTKKRHAPPACQGPD